ncbi:MAG: hypothetical protein HYZ28_27455 [Myxococcales bacterium]|nr:hypothetical protein [Myxococcales bacterium]
MRLALVACATLSACICTPPPPPPDGGDSGGGGGEEDAGDADSGIDAGIPDAGPPPCRIDDDCAFYDQGLRCQESSGECIPAKPCNDDTNCDSQDPDDYCYHYGIQCRCVNETNDAGLAGVCRRRRNTCEECTDDSQCGTSAVFDPPGKCLQLQGDSSGKKYCFLAAIGSCGCGMVNRNGYCMPQKNCQEVGCSEDGDCPAGSVCNKASCLCEARCRWDFSLKTEAPPGCPPGKVCWVDHANLDPSSLFYGAGRCRPACNNDQECTETTLNPFGGPKLKCASEQLSGGGASPKRCRANGECMDNLECPDQPPESIYLGYCDRGAFQCMTDCRVGLDPMTGQPYKDCRSSYKCVTADAGNECVQQTCLEQGGARIACRRGQFCCGEDKNADGTPDPCPPVNLREPDNCYEAPSPPFCHTCQSNADCANYTAPSWLTPCANGSKSPSCSTLPNMCMYAGDRPDGTQGVNICAPSTYNDTTKDSWGVPKDARGCPAGYSAAAIRPKFTGGGDPDFCKTNADCSLGNDGGICDKDTTVTLQDGGHPLACLCTKPGQLAECPNSPDGGMTSVCRFGIAVPTACLRSVVCLPSPGLAYRDAGPPEYGCGL